MIKSFIVFGKQSRKEFECIGDIFIMREKEKEHAINSEDAQRIHHDAMNKARMVRLRKHVDLIMV